MGEIRVGTCAWSDHQGFYPHDLPARARLGFYAQRFRVVEVDSTFYALQPARNFALWAQATSEDFHFNVKAYRALTRHDRTPKPGEEDLGVVAQRFLASVEPIRRRGQLSALHFQFPPWFTRTEESLRYLDWVRQTCAAYRVGVEFRHRSWLADPPTIRETLAYLRAQAFVFTIVDEPQVGTGSVPPVVAVTNPELVIIRLHGRNAQTWYARGLTSSAQRFKYLYSLAELRPWAQQAQALAEAAAEVHVLTNNNFGDYAVRNALQLVELLEPPAPDPAV